MAHTLRTQERVVQEVRFVHTEAHMSYSKSLAPAKLRTPVNNIEYFPPNFEGLVLGCIDADFCK